MVIEANHTIVRPQSVRHPAHAEEQTVHFLSVPKLLPLPLCLTAWRIKVTPGKFNFQPFRIAVFNGTRHRLKSGGSLGCHVRIARMSRASTA